MGTFITGLGRGTKIWTPQSYVLRDLKGLLRHDPTGLGIILENLLYKTAPTQLSNVVVPLPDFLMVTLAWSDFSYVLISRRDILQHYINPVCLLLMLRNQGFINPKNHDRGMLGYQTMVERVAGIVVKNREYLTWHVHKTLSCSLADYLFRDIHKQSFTFRAIKFKVTRCTPN